MTAQVLLDDVTKSFGSTLAVDGVSLEVGEGEFVSLLGPSGCGKTTLLRIIAGFEDPTRGRILIAGNDVTGRPPNRRPTSLVFQRGALFPHMNVAENIAYGLRLLKLTRHEINARVDEMLTLIGLEDYGSRQPTQLSGGQTQRVALARALAVKPSVLLLDEPLSALDLKLRKQMQLELRAIHSQLGTTFLYVTHDQGEALALSDRVVILNHGRVVQVGTPRQIYHEPNSVFSSAFIGETNLMPVTVVEVTAEGIIAVKGEHGTYLVAGYDPGFTVGEKLTLSVRPEAMKVIPSADQSGLDGLNVVTGPIRDVVYAGGRVQVGISVGGEDLLWAEATDREAGSLAVDQSVRLAWKPADATVLAI